MSSWRPIFILLSLLASYRSRLVGTALVALASQLCAVAVTCLGAWLVGKVIVGTPLRELTTGFVVLGACALGQGALAWLRDYAAHDYAFRIITELRLRIYHGLEALAPSYLLRRRTGDLSARLVGDLERLEWLYAHIIPDAFAAIVVPAAALTALIVLSPSMGLTVVLITLLVITVPAWLNRRAHRQGQALREELGTLHAEVVDGIQGLRELVVFGHGPAYLRGLGRRMRSLLGMHLAYGRRAGLETGAADLLVAMATGIAITGTAALVAGGDLAPEYFIVVVLLVDAVLTPVVALVTSLAMLGEVRGCAGRVAAIADAKPLVTERPGAREAILEPEVRFNRVSFGYDPDRPVLHDVELTVRPGETVALVGASGAGKSTCLHLLLRFWDVQSGSIQIGSVDIRDLTLESLRANIALVPQDVYLFHDSLRENIRIARLDASDVEIEQAAKRARCTEFIEALPEGYDTVVSERGLSLSGGQRQRIAIARAFLRDSPVILLDEPVSNIDAENERLVQQALAELRHGRATLIVAHRLSTIRAADRIALLSGGRIAEVGTHSELLAAGTEYARLIHRGVTVL